MICSTSQWSCVYHACMTDECQKKIVNDQGFNWGNGKCFKKKNMFYRANVKMEPNDAALMTVPGIFFQGRFFRPCVGLVLWIRWGQFVIDVRPLRKYLGLTDPVQQNSTRVHIASFHENVQEITTAVGGRNFMHVIHDAIEMLKRDEDETIRKNEAMGITDGLPW